MNKIPSSPIQTILSAPELHRFMPKRLAGSTAGQELKAKLSHLAPKKNI